MHTRLFLKAIWPAGLCSVLLILVPVAGHGFENILSAFARGVVASLASVVICLPFFIYYVGHPKNKDLPHMYDIQLNFRSIRKKLMNLQRNFSRLFLFYIVFLSIMSLCAVMTPLLFDRASYPFAGVFLLYPWIVYCNLMLFVIELPPNINQKDID